MLFSLLKFGFFIAIFESLGAPGLSTMDGVPTYLEFEYHKELQNNCAGRVCEDFEYCFSVLVHPDWLFCSHRGVDPDIMGQDIQDLGEGRCSSLGYCGAISRAVTCPICEDCKPCAPCNCPRVRNCKEQPDIKNITTTTEIPMITTTTQIVTTTVVNFTFTPEAYNMSEAIPPANDSNICEKTLKEPCPTNFNFISWGLVVISWVIIIGQILYMKKRKRSYRVQKVENQRKWEWPEFLNNKKVHAKKAVRSGIRRPWNALRSGLTGNDISEPVGTRMSAIEESSGKVWKNGNDQGSVKSGNSDARIYGFDGESSGDSVGSVGSVRVRKSDLDLDLKSVDLNAVNEAGPSQVIATIDVHMEDGTKGGVKVTSV